MADRAYAKEQGDHAKEQGDRCEVLNDHPQEIRSDGYIWAWNETTEQMENTGRRVVATLDISSLTPEQQQELIDMFVLDLATTTEASGIADGTLVIDDSNKEKVISIEALDAYRDVVQGFIDTITGKIPSEATAQNQLADKAYVTSTVGTESSRAQDAEGDLQDAIDAIDAKIPSTASSSNKLVDTATMNSSISTATATYRGSYNLVSDLHETVGATHAETAAALATAIATADNNDYCYVQVPTDTDTPTVIASVDRYKHNGEAWSFEYTLNSSGFTAAQWDALNSGITSGLVAKLDALPTSAELTALLAGKEDVTNVASQQVISDLVSEII